MLNTNTDNPANQHNGLLQERETFDRLGLPLHDVLGPGDEQIELTAGVTTSTNEQHSLIFNPNGRFTSSNGSFNDHGGSSEVSRAIKDHRDASYRANSRTWFGILIVVTASGGATATYNFDDEPVWDFPMDPTVYVRDQLKYPRDDHRQPEWPSRQRCPATSEGALPTHPALQP
jgi:hypothetical protein